MESHETIRIVIALACSRAWPLFQLDVKSDFLYGPLKEVVFVDQPLGFVFVDRVYRFHKALYWLK